MTATTTTRADRLVAELDGAGIDVLLVDELTNVRYLTGYTGSNGLALIGPRTRMFVTDFRYVEQAAEEVGPEFERHRGVQDLVESLRELLPEGTTRLGIDERHMSLKSYRRVRELAGDGVELVDAGGLVEGLRRVKEPGEVQRLTEAQRIADAAFRATVERGLAGRTEREVARHLEQQIRERGAKGPSFDAIVAAGPHGALPHAQPREATIERGQLVVIDWGGLLDGYYSDCTRTVAAGEPSPQAREVYEVVLAAQLAGLDAARPGVGGREAHEAAAAVIDAAGYGEHFGHGLGHGVGLEIHEAPTLSLRSTDELAVGNVFSVEPGIYLPGRLGVRIEDVVVLEQDGPRIITPLSKELLIVD